MSYWVTRTQQAVGQGGFHTASIDFCPNWCDPPFSWDGLGCLHEHSTTRYVYDCGEYGRSRSNVLPAVAAYVQALNGADLDVLFISHAHADHTNAINDLILAIQKSEGRVKTIVLPLLNPLERLVAYVQSAEPEDGTIEGLALDILIDPVTALSPLAADLVFIVGDGDAPDDFDVDPDDQNDNDPSDGDNDLRALVERLPFKLEGGSLVRQGGVVTLSHTVNIVLTNPNRSWSNSEDDWCLRTFIDPNVFDQKTAFVTELKRRLQSKTPPADHLVDKLTVSAMRELLTTYADDLTKAYEAAITPKDVNVTSMSLYSGPRYHSRRGKGRLRIGGGIIPAGSAKGWLLTGDACLGVRNRLDKFLQHFDEIRRTVAVLTLPHHGSVHNFGIDLLGRWSARALYTTNANPPANWRHPDSLVVNAVSSIGARMHTVTDAELSTIEFTAGNAI